MNNEFERPVFPETAVPSEAPAAATAPAVSSPALPEEPVFRYTALDGVFAWLCFLFGYLFCRAYPASSNPFGAFLLVLIAFVSTYIVLKLKKTEIPPSALLSGVAAVAVSAALLLTESKFLVSLSYLYALTGYFYFVYAATGNCLQKGFSDLVLADYFKALFVLPFRSLSHIFLAISSGKAKGGVKVLLKVLCGAAIAVVPTVVILSLLSYDDSFVSILKNIFSFNFSDIVSHIGSLMLAVPIGMYVFGAFASAVHKRASETITAEGWQQGVERMRILPRVTAVTAVLPILFLYVVYFISQWQYYISGFTGVLPTDFSYAEYARQGFFQLCTVSVINLAIIVILVLFLKRGTKPGSGALLKLLAVVFCTCTLVLISTAVAKLVMYIDYYGLTQKRVYAMWLMAVIALVYLVIAIGLFLPRLKTVAVSVSIVTVMFAVLALSGVNSLIAEYNVDRYLDGTLETVDLEAMDELDDAAVPSLVRLAEVLRERDRSDDAYAKELYEVLDRRLRARADNMRVSEQESFAFNFPSYFAQRALAEYVPAED